MKKGLLVKLLTLGMSLIAQTTSASNGLQCQSEAEYIIAKSEFGITANEFRETHSLLVSEMKNQDGEILEEFQFGSSSGFYGIVMKRENESCAQAGEIYSGQDDQD